MSAETVATRELFSTRAYAAPRSYILRHARIWMSINLVLSDLISLVLAGMIAIGVHEIYLRGFNFLTYIRFFPAFLIFAFIFYVRGLYPGVGLGAVEELRRLAVTISALFLMIAASAFMVKSDPIYSRFNFFASWGLAVIFVPLNRSITRYLLSRMGLWGEPVVVAGPMDQSAHYVHFFSKFPRVGLIPVAVFDGQAVAGSKEDFPILPMRSLQPFCTSRQIKTVLVVCNDLNEIDSIRLNFQDQFERVLILHSQDRGLNLSSVSVSEFGEVLGLEVRHNLLDNMSQFEKRMIDIVAAGLGLLILMPLFGLISLLIKLDDPGRVFYRQKRLGKDGQVFALLKFRTMHMNADEYLRTCLENNPEMKKEWDQYQKLKHDPRITRVGNFLRRFSLDELPQLWNVLNGDMSLVGPRPIMLNQQELYGEPFAHYTRVMPGITGLWQISGRNHTSFARRAELDVHYVMNWSLWLDIYILTRTVWVVLRRDGAC